MLRIGLTPSRLLAAALTGAHAIALAAVAPLQLGTAAKLVLAAGIAASLVHAVCRHALIRSRSAIIALELNDGDTCRVTQRNGGEYRAAILGTTYVTPWLTVMNLQQEREMLARHVLIVPDNVDRELFRQLRVILRWKRRHDASAGAGTRTSGAP